MSGTSKDDEAWRSIVENYGERPDLEAVPDPLVEPLPGPTATADDPEASEDPDPTASEPDRFVPPEPPPAPAIVLPRHLPWVGVFGVPTVLLVTLLAGVGLPTWLGYLLVSSFVGSFIYLVLTMKPGGRDPYDDGARL